MRKTILTCLFAIAALSTSSCTTVRDTTPCNNSRYLAILEKPTLTADEIATRDSFAMRCEEYKRLEAARAEEKPEGAGWLGVGLGVAAALIILYFTGVII
jgi:hypothetical protein